MQQECPIRQKALQDHGATCRSRRLEAVQTALPEEAPQKLQTRGSDSLSLESCGTPMASAASHEAATDDHPSDSEGSQDSETTPANLANNPYALVDQDQVGLCHAGRGDCVPPWVLSA